MNKWVLSFNHNIIIFILIPLFFLTMHATLGWEKLSDRTLYIANFNNNQSKSSIKYSIIINIVIIIIYFYYRIKQQNKNEDDEGEKVESDFGHPRSIIFLIKENPYLLPILLTINMLYLIRKLIK